MAMLSACKHLTASEGRIIVLMSNIQTESRSENKKYSLQIIPSEVATSVFFLTFSET